MAYDGGHITAQECRDIWLGDGNPEFWSFYLDGLMVTAVLAAIVWALAYAITYTIRWILAGRKTTDE